MEYITNIKNLKVKGCWVEEQMSYATQRYILKIKDTQNWGMLSSIGTVIRFLMYMLIKRNMDTKVQLAILHLKPHIL